MMPRSVRYVARGIDADQLHPAFRFFRDGADRQVGVQVMLLLELLPKNIGHRGRSARMFIAGYSDDAEDPPSSHTPDHIMRAPSKSPSWGPPSPRDRKHGGVPSSVLGAFAAVDTERAALRALSEHGSAEPDLGWRFRFS